MIFPDHGSATVTSSQVFECRRRAIHVHFFAKRPGVSIWRAGPILIAISSAFVPWTADAATALTLTPNAGHPSVAVAVSGSGFGVSEAVDIYVDVTDTELAVTSATGTLTASLTIPASAQPGVDYITAIGRKSGDTVQTAFTVSTSWAEAGFGAAQLNWNPWENTLSPSTVPSLGLLWSTSIGATNGAGGISVAGGRVFVTTASGVAALSASTGAVLWTANTGVPNFYPVTPAVAGNSVYVGGANGFYALNANTGATEWLDSVGQSSGGSNFTSAIVTNGVVYVGNSNNYIYAISASTGKTIWSHSILSAPNAAPTIAHNIVFVPGHFDSGYAVFRLDQATGIDLNILGLNYFPNPVYSVTVSAGVAFLNTGLVTYAFNAFNRPNGSIWARATAGLSVGTTAVADGTLYVAAGNLGASNTWNGSSLWTIATAPDGGGFAFVSVTDGVVYAVSNAQGVYAYSASNGALLWSGATQNGAVTQPVVANGVLYLEDSTGTVYACAPYAGTNLLPPRRMRPRPSSLHPDYALRPAN